MARSTPRSLADDLRARSDEQLAALLRLRPDLVHPVPADLAALDTAQAADLDAQLGNFRGRMGRDKWIEQARLLDAGDIAGYEAQFGKLG